MAKPKPKHTQAQTQTSTPIPPAFQVHKSRILSNLSTPEEAYSDASPKGSVDIQIRDLIDAINALHGVVTTSSCSGRIAVFVEGRKTDSESEPRPTERDAASTQADLDSKSKSNQKGLAGHWLFVSHDPLVTSTDSSTGQESLPIPAELHPLLSLPSPAPGSLDTQPRLVTLHFEPLILHITTATLHHAHALLSLALQAGFRESGLQSLKCLDNPQAWPMVAIRSAGMAFSSVVGFVDDDGQIRGLVREDVLRLLLGIANARFGENRRRTERVRDGVEALLRDQELRMSDGGMGGVIGGGEGVWEDKDVRAARMKAEGLRRKAAMQAQSDQQQEQNGSHNLPLESMLDQESFGFGHDPSHGP